MWIYYSCSHGPGHQSRDSGFKYFSDNWTMEDIKEHLERMCDDYYFPILDFWEVEKPPAHILNNKIENTKDKIKNLRKYLKELKTKTSLCPEEEKEGKDLVIQRNLKKKMDVDVLRRLHKAGFMFTDEDISNWILGRTYPTGVNRSKILRIIRKSKSYR